MGLNLSIVMGRLTADPELRTTTSGISVTSFTVAVDRKYKSGEKRETDFIDCVAWRETADFVSRYFKKGQMIAVCGSTQTRMVENKNGYKYKASEINVESVSFCGDKNTTDNGKSAMEQAVEMVNRERAERASANAESETFEADGNDYSFSDEFDGAPF